jgi:hypothetical protein
MIPDGIEINNNAIGTIAKEFRDIHTAASQFNFDRNATVIEAKLRVAAEKAYLQKDMQSAI